MTGLPDSPLDELASASHFDASNEKSPMEQVEEEIPVLPSNSLQIAGDLDALAGAAHNPDSGEEHSLATWPSSPVHPAGPSVPDPFTDETPLFSNYEYHPPAPYQRIPNFGHVFLFFMLVVAGYLCSDLVSLGALHFHLFGVSTIQQSMNDIHYTLGGQVVWYLATIAACLIIFPFAWRRGFFDGLEWHAGAALQRRWRLVGAAVVCFVLAIVDAVLIPGPKDAPIDEVFKLPGAAWSLFAFGVTLAPLIEEIGFRGFLLPALCTAWDWTNERITGAAARPLDADGYPQWSLPAMVIAAVVASVPFALMHAPQTGYSLGPFLLLVCVSLVLCWVRLAARSLAASVLVHSCYNLLIFSLMLLGTGGFKHLDRM